MTADRFGNPHAPKLLLQARQSLRSMQGMFRSVTRLVAKLIRERGLRNIYIFTWLGHGMPASD